MKTPVSIPSALLALAILSMPLFACAADQPVQTESSEFLDIHPELKPDSDRSGAMVWEAPDFNRAKYKMVIFAPLTIFVDPKSEYQGLNTEDARALEEGFRSTIVQTLEPEIPVVSVPGEGVLYIRAALTHLRLKKASRGLLSYTPIGLIVTAAQDAAGKRISLQNAALEIEAYDSVTREPMAVMIDARPGKETDGGQELSWKNIEDTMKFYAERFKERMLAARQKAGG